MARYHPRAPLGATNPRPVEMHILVDSRSFSYTVPMRVCERDTERERGRDGSIPAPCDELDEPVFMAALA